MIWLDVAYACCTLNKNVCLMIFAYSNIDSSNPKFQSSEETSALSHIAEDYFACLGGIWWVFLVMT